MPRLEVKVGADRFHMEPCRVNDSHRPHEIKTEHFVGRVLVRILDYPGARPGEEGREYFRDRNRKFCIQIEGRFAKPWNGNEVLFGTDFDRLIDFPRAPFNAGMKVAQFIDPCTFYEEKPPSGRPYIMSPMVACMNTLAAWPAPHREHDAVVVLRDVAPHQDEADTPKKGSVALPDVLEGAPQTSSPASEVPTNSAGPSATGAPAGENDEDDIVPVEAIDRQASQDEAAAKSKKRRSWFGGFGKKEDERRPKRYWRFVGFKNDVRVRAFLEAHDAHVDMESSAKATADTTTADNGKDGASTDPSGIASPPEIQHAPGKPTLSRLGTFSRKDFAAIREAEADGNGTGVGTHTPVLSATSSGVKELGDEIAALALGSSGTTGASANSEDPHPSMPPLERISTDVRSEMAAAAKKDGLQSKDFKLADSLHHHHQAGGSNSGKMGRSASTDGWVSQLDDELGPWRFADPSTDMLEDNAFIFTNQSLPVPRRRKHFANLKNRLDFHYDPDVVFGAAFYTDMADLNTFDVNVGPVHINVARFFKDMPIRYTLRAADEDITFCTISFQLVD